MTLKNWQGTVKDNVPDPAARQAVSVCLQAGCETVDMLCVDSSWHMSRSCSHDFST